MSENKTRENATTELTDEELMQANGGYLGDSTDVIFRCPTCGYSKRVSSQESSVYMACPRCKVRMLPHPVPL